MRTLIAACLISLLTSCAGPRAPEPRRPTPDPAPAAEPDSRERLGDLRLGLAALDAIRALGQPARRGKIERWGATGQFHQEWTYEGQGITLEMVADAETGPQTIRGITITAPSTLRTRLGIAIGSTLAQVRQAYGRFESKDAPYDGKRFVAGSLFGGVLFFIDKDRVASIFVGAAAE